MNYLETIDYLFGKVQSFQQVGKAGYKEGLENTFLLDEHFGHTHQSFKSIHIAGTNGKGSCAHTIAAILQSQGYKVGLYTSPHLLDFRERIRVNGKPCSKQFVISFVKKHKSFFEPLSPSFFELTTAMAFFYFKQKKVDFAVIEVGLGGRLDCTNIISPLLSVITNISLDHTQFLGNTHAAIAYEKAGIIKPKTPVVIGETRPDTKTIFRNVAQAKSAPIYFAEETNEILSVKTSGGGLLYETQSWGKIYGELSGLYQLKNTNTILHAIKILQDLDITISDESIRQGFANVTQLTGLQGRWQKIGDSPRVVCDAGHNEGGISYITKQLHDINCKQLRIVFGMVKDKDIDAVLKQMPTQAIYYFTKAAIPRAFPANELQAKAAHYLLKGNAYPTVNDAYQAALKDADAEDFIYVGGSCFIVADFLASLHKSHQ